MPNLIDWYVVELRLLLNGSLPSGRVDEITMEAEAHLRESVHRRLNSSVNESVAIAAAVDAYGRPDKVALGYLKGTRQKMWGLNPGWWAMAGALIAIICWNFHWLTLDAYFDNFGDTWQNCLAGLVGVVGLVLMSVAIRAGLRSYRSWLTALTLAAAALSVPLVSYWMIPEPNYYQGISRFHLDRDLPPVGKTLGSIKAYQSYLARGMRQFASAKSDADLASDLQNPTLAATELKLDRLGPAVLGATMDRGGRFVVPRKYGAFFEINGGSAVLETMDRFEDAKKAWAESGPSIMSDLNKAYPRFVALFAKGQDAKAGKLFFFEPTLYMETVIGTIVLLPLFLILDWIAAFNARPKRRWPRRAIA